MKGLIGKKLGMTQVFDEKDHLVPVTVIEAGPCFVTQIKSGGKDGYGAIQIGYGDVREKHRNKPMSGHFAKSKVEPKKHLKEVRVDDTGGYKLGQEIKADTFAEGDRADVVGVSKGKGFSGGMKRWGFSGGPGGHGSHFHRRSGSIGMAATPARVPKGRKGAGQYGNKKSAITNLEVVKVDAAQNIILVKGAVPGARGSILFIRESKKTAGKQ